MKMITPPAVIHQWLRHKPDRNREGGAPTGNSRSYQHRRDSCYDDFANRGKPAYVAIHDQFNGASWAYINTHWMSSKLDFALFQREMAEAMEGRWHPDRPKTGTEDSIENRLGADLKHGWDGAIAMRQREHEKETVDLELVGQKMKKNRDWWKTLPDKTDGAEQWTDQVDKLLTMMISKDGNGGRRG